MELKLKISFAIEVVLGVRYDERLKPQSLQIEIDMIENIDPRKDALTNMIDYSTLTDATRQCLHCGQFKTLEMATIRVSDMLCNTPGILRYAVRITKNTGSCVVTSEITSTSLIG